MVAKVGVSLFGSFYAFCLEEEAINNIAPTINTISGILMIFSLTWTSSSKMKLHHHLDFDLVLDVDIDYDHHHHYQ